MSQTPSDTKPPGWADSLIELLESQHALVGELSTLADRQKTLVRDRRTEALLGLLTERQQILDRFAGMQERLGSLTADLDRRITEVEDPARTRIQALIGEIGDRLTVVMAGDERDQQSLEAARGDTARELREIDTARVARAAYQGSGPAGSRYADRQG
jgi:hypothetical protein